MINQMIYRFLRAFAVFHCDFASIQARESAINHHDGDTPRAQFLQLAHAIRVGRHNENARDIPGLHHRQFFGFAFRVSLRG